MCSPWVTFLASSSVVEAAFTTLYYLSLLLLLPYLEYSTTCVYIKITCAAPTWDLLEGRFCWLSWGCAGTQHTGSTKAAMLCPPMSLNQWWSARALEKMCFIIIFMKLQDIWAGLKPSRISIHWPSTLCPRGKMVKQKGQALMSWWSYSSYSEMNVFISSSKPQK